MSLIQIIVLALVQGLTEFLPISSSGHLILANEWMGFVDQGVVFDVATHIGSLIAVMIYFRRDLMALASNGSIEGFDESLTGHRMTMLLALATIPLVIVGVTAMDWITGPLRSTLVIATTTIVFGLLLGWADVKRSGSASLDLRKAILIGLAQVLALIPGTSRSGVTMTAALMLGLDRQAAARFSFLLSIPAILAAGGYGFLTMLGDNAPIPWSQFLLAVSVSAVAAFACIAVFLRLLDRIGMMPFVIYRLVLGILLLVFALSAG